MNQLSYHYKAVDATGSRKRGVIQAENQSEAYRQAEEIKGKADAEASAIYARAYGRDEEFYRFWKNLETLRVTLDPNTTLVLTTDAEWLRFLKNARGQ